jgi:hypothetical protein
MIRKSRVSNCKSEYYIWQILTRPLENPNFVYAVLRNKKRFEGKESSLKYQALVLTVTSITILYP